MTGNGLNGSNTQWQHKQQSIDNRQKSKIHKCLYYIFIQTYKTGFRNLSGIHHGAFLLKIANVLLTNIFAKIFIIDV